MLAQNFADKKYYLVDSLNLSKISQPDKIMLDSCLKIFHQTKSEEIRFKTIDFVVENCWDKAIWPKYNQWLHDYAKTKLKIKLSTEDELLFKSMLSTAYNNKGYLADELGKHEWALKYYHNSLAIDRELGNKKGVAQILNNIAGVYIGQAKVNEALQYLEESLKIREEIKDGMDIALCSLEGTTLKYAGANNPLWLIRNKELIEIKANKQPIGQFDNPEPYTTHTLDLQKGDSIYIFSDGYVDQFGGEKGKKFKTQAFRTLLLSIQNQPMQEQEVIINNAFENWKGNLEQIDDVCVIGVRI